MEIFIIWFALSIVAAVIANNKGRSGAGFFLLAVLLSPLVGIIAALIASEDNTAVEGKKLSSGESKKCPFCAELIKVEAKVCKHCGRDLEQPSQPKSHPVKARKASKVINNFDGTYLVEGHLFHSLSEAEEFAARASRNVGEPNQQAKPTP